MPSAKSVVPFLEFFSEFSMHIPNFLVAWRVFVRFECCWMGMEGRGKKLVGRGKECER
jgi:hypothetical protein